MSTFDLASMRPEYPTDEDEPSDRRCAKCGTLNDNPRWHKAEDYDYYSNQGRNSACEDERYQGRTISLDEHLHFYCRCGYIWSTGVLA